MMTNFMSAEFIRHWKGEPTVEPKFECGLQGAMFGAKCNVQCGVLSAVVKRRNFSARHSLSFLARQEPRPPNFSVSCPVSLVPLQVGAQFLSHQLRAEASSMDGALSARTFL